MPKLLSIVSSLCQSGGLYTSTAGVSISTRVEIDESLEMKEIKWFSWIKNRTNWIWYYYILKNKVLFMGKPKWISYSDKMFHEDHISFLEYGWHGITDIIYNAQQMNGSK